MPIERRNEASNGPLELSPAMRFFRWLGCDSLAWASRRLYVPVRADALVLEVGSGANPYPRANVLLDAYLHTRERHFQPLVADRPTVIGLVERLPFRDDAFDFVIASHVLEHSVDPELFLSELQRVARAGYIECPDAIFERLCPYKDHRLEITCRGAVLNIRPKRAWKHDPELSELVDARLGASRRWANLLRHDPFTFHVRLYWSRENGGIRYRLLPTPGPIEFDAGGGEAPSAVGPLPRVTLRERLVRLVRRALSQSTRNRAIDLSKLVLCMHCRSTLLVRDVGRLRCQDCGATYDWEGMILRMHGEAT